MLALLLKATLSPGLEFTKVISILAKTSVEWPSIEEVIMAYKVSFGQDINTGKLSYLLLHMI